MIKNTFKIISNFFKKYIREILIVTAIVFIDLILKYLLIKDKIIIENVLEFKVLYNKGLAFSFLNFIPNIALIVNIAMFIGLIFFYKKYKYKTLIFTIGGGIANLIDRILFGKVTDYIKISKFPVFNFADIMITIGIFLTILIIFKEDKIKSKNKK